MRHLSNDQHCFRAEPDLEHLGIGFLDMDFASGKIHLDEAALQLFGGDSAWILDGVLLSRFLELIHVSDRDCVHDCFCRISPNSASFITEYRTYSDSKGIGWVLVRGRGYFDESGALLRIVGIVVDVTALKTDERAYVSMLPGSERLSDLADIVISARRLIDHLALGDMRPLIDDLLMRIGMRLGAEIKNQAHAALQ